jgi:hypothetical protein
MTMFLKFLEKVGLYDRPDLYTIQKDPTTGKWTIYDEDGFGVAGYSRRRDAFRGAERNGFTLV